MRGFIHQSRLEAALNSSSDHLPETWWNYISAGETRQRSQLSPTAWCLHSGMLTQAQDGQPSVGLTRPWLMRHCLPAFWAGFFWFWPTLCKCWVRKGSQPRLALGGPSWHLLDAPHGTAALPLSRAQESTWQKSQGTRHVLEHTFALGVTFCLIVHKILFFSWKCSASCREEEEEVGASSVSHKCFQVPFSLTLQGNAACPNVLSPVPSQ